MCGCGDEQFLWVFAFISAYQARKTSMIHHQYICFKGFFVSVALVCSQSFFCISSSDIMIHCGEHKLAPNSANTFQSRSAMTHLKIESELPRPSLPLPAALAEAAAVLPFRGTNRLHCFQSRGAVEGGQQSPTTASLYLRCPVTPEKLFASV